MFLIINTSEKLNPHFNCASRVSFASVSSEKFQLSDFQGRLIFDLKQVSGKTIQAKTSSILKSIKWEFNVDKKSLNKEDIKNIIETATNNLKHASNDVSYFSKSFVNDMPIELHHNKPDYLFVTQFMDNSSIEFILEENIT